MHIRLSAVIQLLDGYRRRPIRAAEVSFLLNRKLFKPVYKPEGYFAFPNIPSGPVRIDILSAYFLPETLKIDIPGADGQYYNAHKILNPSRAYPYNGTPTSLRGKLSTDSVSAAYEKMLLYITDNRESIKISQDDLKAGSLELKLFSSQQKRRLPLPGNFLILDKDVRKREKCFVSGLCDNSENTFQLNEALQYAHTRTTPLVELMEFYTDANGSFYIALPEHYWAAQHAEIVIQSSGKTIQINLSRNTETDLGTIELR